MKCEICHRNDAKAAIHKMVGGEDAELYVCEECARRESSRAAARRSGRDDSNSAPEIDMEELQEKLSNALFDAILSVAGPDLADMTEPSCQRCGTTLSEFRKNTLLGCPECYRCFSNEVEAMIRDMHRGTVHVGKVPSAVTRGRESARLAAQLRNAIAEQRFEDAARIQAKLDAVSPDAAKKQQAVRGKGARSRGGRKDEP